MNLTNDANALLPELIRWRRTLHQHAEGGYDLPETLQLIRDVLNAHRVSFSEPCQGTIVCDIGNGPAGMILRADTDALPMHEESGLPFSSETTWAHNCGHDLHTAMLLGAACLLQKHADKLTHRTRLIFQPDEEGATGGKFLLEQGLIEPTYQGAFALHVSPVMKSGVLYYKDGPLYAASDEFFMDIHGTSTHGAAPHNGCDPIFAAVQIYNALQGLMSREISPFDTAVLSVCAITSGTTYNVVPETAQLRGTLRTYDTALRSQLKSRLEAIAAGVAQTLRCTAETRWVTSVPAVTSNPSLNKNIIAVLAHYAPDCRTSVHETPFSWSEDFGYFSQNVPITMMTLGTHVPGYDANIHNAGVRFDENAMPSGVLAHMCAALSVE